MIRDRRARALFDDADAGSSSESAAARASSDVVRSDRIGCGSRRAEGFSLVEMLVVLAILALAAGIGIPSIAGIVPSRRLNAATDAVASELNLLRTETLRTGLGMRIAFDAENRRFLSSRRGAPALSMTDLQIRVEADAMSRAEPGEIRFLPAGGSTGGRIMLAGSGGISVLTVSRITGAVRRVEANP